MNHKLLLEIIAFNYIRGNLLKWFASYIFHRAQKVFINGFKYDCGAVESGVLQGSILSPLLFILLINDIKSCKTDINNQSTDFLIYAQDIQI